MKLIEKLLISAVFIIFLISCAKQPAIRVISHLPEPLNTDSYPGLLSVEYSIAGESFDVSNLQPGSSTLWKYIEYNNDNVYAVSYQLRFDSSSVYPTNVSLTTNMTLALSRNHRYWITMPGAPIWKTNNGIPYIKEFPDFNFGEDAQYYYTEIDD